MRRDEKCPVSLLFKDQLFFDFYSYTNESLVEMYSAMDEKEEFYRYLEIALSKEYPLIAFIEDDEEIKKLYDKYKNEKRFKDIMKKYNIDYPE